LIELYRGSDFGDSCKRILYGDRRLLKKVWDVERGLAFKGNSRGIWGGLWRNIKNGWANSPTWTPTELRLALAFASSMMFGVEKRLSSPHSQNSII
jgi:hypothetical protein